MAEIDIYNSGRRYMNSLRRLEESGISPRNKELIAEFINDCLIGWGGRKIGKLRAAKHMTSLRILAGMLGKDFDYIDKGDVKRLLGMIDADPSKGDWAECDYRVALRKFVSWLREEHGYPEGYPGGC